MTKAFVLVVLSACALFAGDPFLGTWKCNFEKSRTNDPNPPPRPETMIMRYEPVEGGFRITSEAIWSDGQKRRVEHIVIHDGKERPRAGDSPPGDVVICRRPDRYTEELVYKRDAKIVSTITRVVSHDGKTLTYSYAEAPGTVLIYDKQ